MKVRGKLILLLLLPCLAMAQQQYYGTTATAIRIAEPGNSSDLQRIPIRPGDTITMKARITDVYEKTGRTGKMVFIVRETTYENQKGEKVAVVEQSQVRRESGAARE